MMILYISPGYIHIYICICKLSRPGLSNDALVFIDAANPDTHRFIDASNGEMHDMEYPLSSITYYFELYRFLYHLSHAFACHAIPRIQAGRQIYMHTEIESSADCRMGQI